MRGQGGRCVEEDSGKQLEVINQQIKDLVGIYRNAVSRLGMSENELWIWYSLLFMEGRYSQQDICAMWSLTKQTVNSIISNMVRKGFVLLEMIPGSRNRKEIRLTQAGEDYGESVVRPLFEVERRAMEKLSSGERRACTAAFRKYIAFLRAEICGFEEKHGEKGMV